MSLVDPAEARRRRAAARVGSRASLAWVVVGLVCIAVGAALLVRALFGFAELDASGDSGEPPLAVFGMVVGLPLVLLGFFTHIGASRRFTGRLLSAPGIGPGSVLFVGFAVGAWWGVASLADPGALWLVAAGATVLAVVSLAIGVVARARRRAQRAVLDQLVVGGRTTAGVITEIPEVDPSSGGLIGTVTVRFTDAAGMERWVRKTGQWRRSELPATGDPATVLHDPDRPGDESRIWVGPVGSATAADFTRWHV